MHRLAYRQGTGGKIVYDRALRILGSDAGYSDATVLKRLRQLRHADVVYTAWRTPRGYAPTTNRRYVVLTHYAAGHRVEEVQVRIEKCRSDSILRTRRARIRQEQAALQKDADTGRIGAHI